MQADTLSVAAARSVATVEDAFAAQQLARGYVLEPYLGRSKDGRSIFAARWVKKR